MSIDRSEVEKIAELAKLEFSEDELASFTGQFGRILEYVKKLGEVDVAGVEATTHVGLAGAQHDSATRDDQTGRSLPVEEALANAPDPGAGHFRVPKVL